MSVLLTTVEMIAGFFKRPSAKREPHDQSLPRRGRRPGAGASRARRCSYALTGVAFTEARSATSDRAPGRTRRGRTRARAARSRTADRVVDRARVHRPSESEERYVHKVFFAGPHRVRTPQQTLDPLTPLLPTFGDTRLADVMGLVNGLLVVTPVRPSAVALSVPGHTCSTSRRHSADRGVPRPGHLPPVRRSFGPLRRPGTPVEGSPWCPAGASAGSGHGRPRRPGTARRQARPD